MQVWDPTLIIAQIVSLQCLLYLTLGVFEAILLGKVRCFDIYAMFPCTSGAHAPCCGSPGPFVGELSILDVFGWRSFTISHFSGWMIICANMGTACLGALYLMWIVEVGASWR